MEEQLAISYPPNPVCHGRMLYMATLPDIGHPERLVYCCISCKGQAVQDTYGRKLTYRKKGEFYTPAVKGAASFQEDTGDDLDVLSDSES